MLQWFCRPASVHTKLDADLLALLYYADAIATNEPRFPIRGWSRPFRPAFLYCARHAMPCPMHNHLDDRPSVMHFSTVAYIFGSGPYSLTPCSPFSAKKAIITIKPISGIKFISTHQPLRPVSCSRRIVTASAGMRIAIL